MKIHLKCQGVEFWPSLHGYHERNYSYLPNPTDLIKIKEEAYEKTLIPSKAIEYVLSKTLASGVCSGISCYSLYKFFSQEKINAPEGFLIAVFQARTWGRKFLLQAISSYLASGRKILNGVKKGLDWENEPQKLPLLVFLPRLFYPQHIIFAHTVLPFGYREGLENIYIGVYDSNYPGNDTKVLIINKSTYSWQYDDKSSDKWVLTINYLENLTSKVPFLL